MKKGGIDIKKLYPVLMAILLTMLLLVGCSGGETGAFKELGVKSSNIPEYTLASKANSEEIEIVAIDLEEDNEEDARKIAADFIEEQLEAPTAMILIKVDDITKYEIKYFEDEEAAKQLENDPDYSEWPVIVFEQVD